MKQLFSNRNKKNFTFLKWYEKGGGGYLDKNMRSAHPPFNFFPFSEAVEEKKKKRKRG